MGLQRGEHQQKLGPPIRVISTRKEPLNAVTGDDLIREGFCNWTPEGFVSMLADHYRCRPDTLANRIEFEYTAQKGPPHD